MTVSVIIHKLHYLITHRIVVVFFVMLLSITLTASQVVVEPSISVDLLYTTRDANIAAYAAHALARFLSDSYPQYKGHAKSYPDFQNTLTALRDGAPSFAIIDAATLFYFTNDNGTREIPHAILGDMQQIRGTLALYQNFLHVLVDGTLLLDENNPRTRVPLAYYDGGRRAVFTDIIDYIFSADAAISLRTVDTFTDTIWNDIAQYRLGALLFFDTYPSPIVSENIIPNAPVRIMPLSENIIENITAKFSYLHRGTLPTKSYSHTINGSPISTLYIPTVLITHARTDPQLVRHICRAFMDNIAEYRTLLQQFELLTPKSAQEAFGIPLHDGAIHCL